MNDDTKDRGGAAAENPHGRRAADPRTAVTGAIQNLMVARLGRGFLPLGALFAWSASGFALSVPGSVGVAVGAVGAAAAMLAYGLRIVQQTQGRPPRPWMSLAMVASMVPPGFSMYVLAWRGLRGLAVADAPSAVLSAILYLVLGVWVLRTWMQVVEIERLARIMVMNLDTDGEQA